jgi:hypothetical protein
MNNTNTKSIAGLAAAWQRLQALSCAHASKLYTGCSLMRGHRRVSVPEVIEENVEILGSSDEGRIKARVLWYMDTHPAIFDETLGGRR